MIDGYGGLIGWMCGWENGVWSRDLDCVSIRAPSHYDSIERVLRIETNFLKMSVKE